jgi:biotin carboxyl carrier protein
VSDLTPDDVREILRLVDESGVDELDLETPRFSLRFSRDGERRVEERADDGLVDVVAPGVGTCYRAPAPGEAPFVDVGTQVEEGTQVCILEVMKLMNAVVAGVRGTIVEVCVENGAAVQYGDVLFRLRP